MNLKLYVWEDVMCDYTCGLAVALATSKEEAIEIIIAGCNSHYVYNELIMVEPLVIDLNENTKPVGFYVTGGG